jgi:hypothetical protein
MRPCLYACQDAESVKKAKAPGLDRLMQPLCGVSRALPLPFLAKPLSLWNPLRADAKAISQRTDAARKPASGIEAMESLFIKIHAQGRMAAVWTTPLPPAMP